MSAGYAERAPTQREIDEMKKAMAQNMLSLPGPRRDDTPDHHSVGSMVNLLNNDMAQLIEEIGELRARLAVIRAEPSVGGEKMGVLGPPVSCKMAAELGDVYQRVSEARRLVQMTLGELDL